MKTNHYQNRTTNKFINVSASRNRSASNGHLCGWGFVCVPVAAYSFVDGFSLASLCPTIAVEYCLVLMCRSNKVSWWPFRWLRWAKAFAVRELRLNFFFIENKSAFGGKYHRPNFKYHIQRYSALAFNSRFNTKIWTLMVNIKHFST